MNMFRKTWLLSITLLFSFVSSIDARRCTDYQDIFIPFANAVEGQHGAAGNAAAGKGHWEIIKRLYEQNLIEDLDWSDEPRIPKIIHHIWLGSPLPEKCRVLRETWIQNHPDWEFILWTDKDIEEFGLENKDLYDASSNYGEKSDIARYELVYRLGGLYVDTDFECIKPMDVLHHCLDFYTGIYASNMRGGSPTVTMGNGMIAGCAGHPILRAAIDGMKGTTGKGSSSSILARTGPYFFTRIVLANAGKNGLRDVVFPPMFVYPTPISGRGQSMEQRKKFVKHSTFANHHWHMSWINRGGKKPAPKR